MTRTRLFFQRTRRFWVISHMLFLIPLFYLCTEFTLDRAGVQGWDGWVSLLVGTMGTIALATLTLLELLHDQGASWLQRLVGVFEIVLCLSGGWLFFFDLFYPNFIATVTVLCFWLLTAGIRDLVIARSA